MGEWFARVVEKLPGYSVEHGWFPHGMGSITDLEMRWKLKVD